MRENIPTLVLLWFAGLYLRLPVLVTAPLAPTISDELGLNQTAVGLLTTIPVLMLSLAALPGSAIIARLGAQRTLIAALVVLAFASVARALAPPIAVLFAATIVVGAAISVMQPAFPALVIRWCPSHIALGSAIYMNGMLMGEFIGGGLTLPFLMPLLDGSWRMTLAVWSLPALLVVLAMVLMKRDPGSGSSTAAATNSTAVMRSGKVWQLGIVLGAASAGYFGPNAYMGTIAANAGQADDLSQFLFVFNITQVFGSLTMIVLGPYLIGKRWAIQLAACGVLLSLVGMMFLTGLPLMVAVVVLGFATCAQLILVVGLVPQIASEAEAPPLAAGTFAVGYFLAFAVPLVAGLTVDATGMATLILAPMALLALIASLSALTLRLH